MSTGRLTVPDPSTRTQSVSTIIYEPKTKPASTEVQAIPAKGIAANHPETVERTHSLSSAVQIVVPENRKGGFRAAAQLLAKGIVERINTVFHRIFSKKVAEIPGFNFSEKINAREIEAEALQHVRLANPNMPRSEWKANTYVENYKNYIGVQLQLRRPGTSYATKSLKTLINRENNSLSPEMKKALNSLIATVSSVEKAEEAKIYFAEAKKVSFSDQEKYLASFEGGKEKIGQILGLDGKNMTLKELKDACVNTQIKLPASVEIELENHFTTLESMDFMLSSIPKNPDAEFYQKGASILKKEINSLYDGFTGQVKTFLQSKNYQLDAVPTDYDNAPKDMDAVKHNLAILDQCLGEGDPLEFRSTAKQIAGEFYETIQPLLGKFKEAAINSMGLTGDQWTGEALLNKYNELQVTQGNISDNNLKDILSNIAFLEQSERKDFADNNGEKVKAEVEAPTALGLILNVAMRDQIVCKTVVETFDHDKKS